MRDMSMANNYEKVFSDLNIKIEPLGDNYDPDSFGRELMKDVIQTGDVVYGSSISFCQIPNNSEKGNKNAYA